MFEFSLSTTDAEIQKKLYDLDRYAIPAMAEYVRYGGFSPKDVAENAYLVADLMIAERDKRKDEGA